jgi:hypothetical protein
MTALKNAAEIKHMADHGYESVEGRHIDFPVWCSGTDICNPITHPYREWRINPATLRINVEIPRPVVKTEHTYPVYIRADYVERKDAIEAKRILVAALRGE